MPDENDEFEELMERLEEMSDAPGSDDIIELHGSESGFSERGRAGIGAYAHLQRDHIIYTNGSG